MPGAFASAFHVPAFTSNNTELSGTAEVFQTVYKVPPAKFAPGMYRNITGENSNWITVGLNVRLNPPNPPAESRSTRIIRE